MTRGPQVHVLIVGVSHYPHLPGGNGARGPSTYGMSQLTGAAQAAANVSEWLDDTQGRLPARLGTKRVLLSPSRAELAANPGLTGFPPATLATFREEALAWRNDCASHRDNVALFYFAGHGVHAGPNMVVLLEEFARDAGDPLAFGVSVSNLFNGMAPAAATPQMARNQLWFVDACQTLPRDFLGFRDFQPSGVFPVALPARDDRCAPIFYAALPGTRAYSIPKTGTLFSKVLIECLDGAAGQRRGNSSWRVTVGSLLGALQTLMNEVPNGPQATWTGGQISTADRLVVTLEGTPQVRVRLELRPAATAGRVSLAVTGPQGESVPVPTPLQPNPFESTWLAGVYEVAAAPPYDDVVPPEPFWVIPPVAPWDAEVQP